MSDITETPTPLHVPPVQTPPVDESTVAIARKLARTKAFAKKTFSNVGVPVLIGAAAAFVVSKRHDSETDEDSDSTDDTDTNE